MPEEEIVTPVETPEVKPVEKAEKPEVDLILASLGDDESPATEASEVGEEGVKESPDDKVEDDKEVEPETEKDPQLEAKPEAEQKNEEETLDPKEEARRRYEEREKARTERATRVAEQTKPYVDEAVDDTDARLRAMEVQQYNQLIEHSENTLIGEFERVKANPDLQIFNPDSEQFDQKLYTKAMKDYNAGYITYDTNGNMVGLKGSLYQHLTETAELYRGAIKSGAFQQVRDQRKMKVNSDSKPAASPKEETKDPLMEVLLSD